MTAYAANNYSEEAPLFVVFIYKIMKKRINSEFYFADEGGEKLFTHPHLMRYHLYQP